MVYDDEQTETHRLSKAEIDARLAEQKHHTVRTTLGAPEHGASATNFTPQGLPKPEPSVIVDALLSAQPPAHPDVMPLWRPSHAHLDPAVPVDAPGHGHTAHANRALTIGVVGLAVTLMVMSVYVLFLL